MSSTTSGACKKRKNATAEEEIHKIPKIDIFFKDCSHRKTGDGGSGDKGESELKNIDRTTILRLNIVSPYTRDHGTSALNELFISGSRAS